MRNKLIRHTKKEFLKKWIEMISVKKVIKIILLVSIIPGIIFSFLSLFEISINIRMNFCPFLFLFGMLIIIMVSSLIIIIISMYILYKNRF